MDSSRRVIRALALASPEIIQKHYLIRDQFCIPLAVGAVNNSPSSPGLGKRIAVDVGGNISVVNGVLNFAGGTTVYGETVVALNVPITRPAGYATGKVIEFDITPDADKQIGIGLATTTTPIDSTSNTFEHAIRFMYDSKLDIYAGGVLLKADAATYQDGVKYRVRFVIYSSGCFYSISGGTFGTFGKTYTALHECIALTTSPLYAAVSNKNAIFTVDNIILSSMEKAITFANYVTDIPFEKAQALRNFYRLTAGNAWTVNTNWLSTTTAANWYSVTVAGGVVTKLEPYSNNLVGSLETWNISQLPSLTSFQVYTNTLSGNIGPWVLPTSLVTFNISTTSVSGSVASWVLPTSLVTFNISTTSVSGSVASWVLPTSLVTFNISTTSLTGSVASWVLPTSLVTFNISTTSVSGNIGGWVLRASLVTFCVNSTSITGTPVFTSAVALADFQCQNCALVQSAVDKFPQRIYARRASFTYATPTLNVGGTNATPSGTYADEDPPTTGKGYIYELVNDPETEGFNKWTITYTA
jgi:hypothetical protein